MVEWSGRLDSRSTVRSDSERSNLTDSSRRRLLSDLRTPAFVLAGVDAAFLATMHARPGLTGVALWYLFPVPIALVCALLLAIAFWRSWRRREVPNRRQVAAFAALGLVAGSLAAFRTYPSSHDDSPSNVRFRLPLDGPLTVAWGGPTLEVNYHGVMPDQRWAYDLLVTVDGRTFRRDGATVEDYHSYGRRVRAPAAGLVRSTHDGEPDGPIGQWRFLGAMGNYLVLEVAADQFLFIAHLQPGSLTVAPGDRVAAGQVLGRVGNSGNSSEPHVHVHLQDTPTPFFGEGIPFYFHGYRVAGVEMERGMPVGGRERRSRRSPGAFIGDTVEQVTSTEPQGRNPS